MSENVIKCESVYKIFGENAKKMLEESNGNVDAKTFQENGCIVGVNNASFEVSKGEMLVVMGLSGSGKSTIANQAVEALHELGIRTYILDGDNIRHGLSKDLGFTEADRIENTRRIGEVAKLMLDAGLVVITAFISPFKADRDLARRLFEPEDFDEVFVSASLNTVERRDPKGLYKKARSGELKNFTGIDSPYEKPESPEITLPTMAMDAEAAADRIIKWLEEQKYL